MALAELNYNHLFYFWTVARHGSVVAAARELLISQPTISTQIRDLELSLSIKLFERSGRGLVLTEIGKTVFQHAEEIFAGGESLLRAIQHQSTAVRRLTVGIADAVPKDIVRNLLQPALKSGEPLRIIFREDKADRLIADLAFHRLDVVLVDAPLGASVHMRGESFLVAESAISFLATADLTRKYSKGFPQSLDGAPLLLPSDTVAARIDLLEWFQHHNIHPEIVAEFDDSATMASFGKAGLGIFPAPASVAKEICRDCRVHVVAQVSEVIQRFYAVTTEQRLNTPAVEAICRQKEAAGGIMPPFLEPQPPPPPRSTL